METTKCPCGVASTANKETLIEEGWVFSNAFSHCPDCVAVIKGSKKPDNANKRMNSTSLIKALKDHEAEHGVCNINISITKPETETDQQYLMSEPSFVVAEDYDGKMEISIRDWPY